MATNDKWVEIDTALEKSKRDLKLSGEKVDQRLADVNGVLPASLWKLTMLTKLEISSLRSLQVIPDDISLLGKNLKELILSDNSINKLPSTLNKLVELKTLILENNQLDSIPKEFGKMKNLQVVNLSGNKLESLPEEFGQLSELITLNLAKNQFKTFPAQLCKLHRLSSLNFCFNSLESLSEDMEFMEALQTLDLSNNKLVEVPSLLGNVPKLKDIKLDNNPYKDKKFVKLLESGKVKNILQHLKKTAPPKKVVKEQVHKKTRIHINHNNIHKATITDATKIVRPFGCFFVFKGLKFTEASFKKFIDLQTDIHQTICKKRTIAALGTHDLPSIKEPVVFTAKNPENIAFVPLREDSVFTGEELLSHFEKTDPTMTKYFKTIKNYALWPVLLDAHNEVLSLPPIMNSKYSQITVQSVDILVECSAPKDKDLDVCKEVCKEFIKKTCVLFIDEEKSTDQIVIEPVQVHSEAGELITKYPTTNDLSGLYGDE